MALAALVTCAIAVGGGALAWACTPDAVIDLNGGGTGPAGSAFTVNGQGFGANANVTIYFDGAAVGSARSSAAGVFTATATVPSNATPGTHNVVAWNPEGSAGDSFVVTGGSSEPAPSPGGGDGGGTANPAPGGSAGGGPTGSAGAPGVSSGRTSGGNVDGPGRESGRVSGGAGSRSAERGSSSAGAEIGGPALATTGSGDTVFADSLGTRDPVRKAAAAKAAPSARSASGDLWGGFASGKDRSSGGLADGAVPSKGPGSGLTLSLALTGLGLTALMAGAGATALRRRRAVAGRSSD